MLFLRPRKPTTKRLHARFRATRPLARTREWPEPSSDLLVAHRSSCCVPPANQTARAPRRAHAAGVNWSSAASGRNASPSEKHQKHVVQTCGRLVASFYYDAGRARCPSRSLRVACRRGTTVAPRATLEHTTAPAPCDPWSSPGSKAASARLTGYPPDGPPARRGHLCASR